MAKMTKHKYLRSWDELTTDQRLSVVKLRPNWTCHAIASHLFWVEPDGTVGKTVMPKNDLLMSEILDGGVSISKHDVVGNYRSATLHLAPEKSEKN